MKRLISLFIVSLMILSLPIMANAGGGDCVECTIDGFDYTIWIWDYLTPGMINDCVSVEVTGYNGMNTIEKSQLPVPVPTTMYTCKILEAVYADYEGYIDNIFNPEWEQYWYVTVPVESDSFTVYDESRYITVKAGTQGGNAETIAFPDQIPVIVNGRTMVPVRAVSEYFGWTVNYDYGMINITNPSGSEVTLYVNDPYMYTENDYIELEARPVIVNNRTVVPLRALSEALGLNVTWSDAESCVYLSY